MKIVSVFLLFISFISGEICEVQNMEEAELMIEKSQFADWVLFDIDYTITEPSHPALQMSKIHHNIERFQAEMKKLTVHQREMLPIIMVTHFPSQLTDPMIPQMIKRIQNNGVTVIGFTAADTASIPEIGEIPTWRANELDKLQVHFSKIFNNKRIEFKEFPHFRETYPIYENGILYCNVTPGKGPVLKSFIEKTSTSPKGVVFIDDSLKNLQSVEIEMKKKNIPFLGLHYRVQSSSKLVEISDKEWNSVWSEVHDRLKPFE